MQTIKVEFINRLRFNLGKVLAYVLKVAKYEDKWFYAWKTDPVAKFYDALDRYVDAPDKATKATLADITNKYWGKLPKEIKSKGHAYRIWIFNKAKTKEIVSRLRRDSSITVEAASFLSFTGRLPTGNTIANFWSVFRSSDIAPGFFIVVQRHDYEKGVNLTEFFKYLLTSKYLVEEEDVDDTDTKIYMDQIDEDALKLMNEEQEILVFDPTHEITPKEIIGMKVVVPGNYKKADGIAVKFLPGVKLVDVGSIDEASIILRDLGVHV